MRVDGQRHAPVAIPPVKRPGTHRTGGWVGLRSGLDDRGKPRPPPVFDPPNRPVRSASLYRLHSAELTYLMQILPVTLYNANTTVS